MSTPRPAGKARIEKVTWSPDAPWRWEIADPTAWRFHAGYARSWDAALFGVGLARRQIMAGSVSDLEPPDSAEWAGGCGIRGCRCSDPTAWLVCGEWAGIDGETGRGCPCCGWTYDVHRDPAVRVLTSQPGTGVGVSDDGARSRARTRSASTRSISATRP